MTGRLEEEEENKRLRLGRWRSDREKGGGDATAGHTRTHEDKK